jgi:hypothetical protein
MPQETRSARRRRATMIAAVGGVVALAPVAAVAVASSRASSSAAATPGTSPATPLPPTTPGPPTTPRPPGGGGGAPPAPVQPPLTGTSWVLDPASLGAPVPRGSVFTARFSATEIRGTSACGEYRVAYSVAQGVYLKVARSVVFTKRPPCTAQMATADRTFAEKLSATVFYLNAGTELRLAGVTSALRFRSA